MRWKRLKFKKRTVHVRVGGGGGERSVKRCTHSCPLHANIHIINSKKPKRKEYTVTVGINMKLCKKIFDLRERKEGGRRWAGNRLSAFRPFDKQRNNNVNTHRYILCEHSAPSCPESRQKTLSTRTHSEPVRQFEVCVIPDTL